MQLLDLFSGIGGFSLAAHWMGWETVAFVENDDFCQKVLRKNFPDVPIYGDIHDFNGTGFTADIICGGFPCQPYSLAGKRKGTADNRHLWPEMLRVVKEAAPRFVVGENVYGLINWSDGLVFDQIQADLEAAGFDVWTGVLPACAVNAPHQRERIWFVGNADRCDAARNNGAKGSYTNFAKRQTEEGFQTWDGRLDELVSRDVALRADTYAGARRVLDGIPGGMDRLKALGNSVVPLIPFEIFKAIEAADNETVEAVVEMVNER